MNKCPSHTVWRDDWIWFGYVVCLFVCLFVCLLVGWLVLGLDLFLVFDFLFVFSFVLCSWLFLRNGMFGS